MCVRDKAVGCHKLIGRKKPFFSVRKKPPSKRWECRLEILPISHFCEYIQTCKGTTVTAPSPKVVFALIMYPPPKNRARSPQQSKPDYSFLDGEKGREEQRNKGEGFQRTATKYKTDTRSLQAFSGQTRRRPESCATTFLSDVEEIHRSSVTGPGTMRLM